MILYEIEPTDNKRLLLLRELEAHRQHVGNYIYLTPEVLKQEYGIDLQTIQSVLMDLEELEHIEIEQKPNRHLSYQDKLKKDDEQDYYIVILNDSFTAYYKMLEQTESFHRADVSNKRGVPQGPMTATLSFERMTIPVVSIGKEQYQLPFMRDGVPINVVRFCLENHPSEAMPVKKLRNELKAAGYDSSGLDDLRERLRKSLFGDDKCLQPFVVVSPKAILVYQTIVLTTKQLEKIKAKASDISRNSPE